MHRSPVAAENHRQTYLNPVEIRVQATLYKCVSTDLENLTHLSPIYLKTN
jgi:hypothetical protein